ncbi:hypothetical protein CPJCM30710_26070 [Clostridium polyendosporum]|uniref:Cell wall hydrolase SleB domain-containing protein n=1 Tax=Clostridium polyendosporum TaxID=69208 RepID=A0A919VHQ2_9CLOT|nr:cell wall hydrolase [Clostridium polyendosporum]GIM29941.1 hypothetical protein CPJCM30710_26070 [Clostridium polyendosporum]
MSKIKRYIFFLLTFLLIDSVGAFAVEIKLSSPMNENPKIILNKDLQLNNIKLSGRGLSNEAKELYHEKEAAVEVFSHANKRVYITKDDLYLMSQVVFAESHGEPYEGKVAVASVILNRVVSATFPNSIEGVIKQKNAFSCIKNGNISVVPDSDSYLAVIDAVRGKDPTDNALFFYNPQTATCSWMKQVQKKNIKPIGRHVFFQITK